MIKADEQTNALIITAAPDVMRDLEAVVAKLDVRRAQVLVEAVIVEVQDGQGLNIGVQWANKYGGGIAVRRPDARGVGGVRKRHERRVRQGQRPDDRFLQR